MPHFIIILSFGLFYACSMEEERIKPNYNSEQYALCNSQLSECFNGNGNYCLFGYKWGVQDTVNRAGYNALGPKLSGGKVTFSFQEENGFVNTHRQVGVPSLSFKELVPCSQEQIREALKAWAAVADIQFIEQGINSTSQIKFYVANIQQSGVGFPNLADSLCADLGGTVIFKSQNRFNTCNSFYLLSLHEIGHALGLGHVKTKNIMNPNFSDLNISGLQYGDSLGMVQIYGSKQK